MRSTHNFWTRYRLGPIGLHYHFHLFTGWASFKERSIYLYWGDHLVWEAILMTKKH